MTTRCPEGSELFDDDRPMCEKHVCATEPVVATEPPPISPPPPGPAAAPSQNGRPAREPWTAAVCWRCETPSPNLTNTECLNPECRSSLTPPLLHIRFRDGEVGLILGQRVELGRHGSYARVFRAFPNVSRRHAVVGVEADGRAWIEALPTPNGTWVNGREISESVSTTLSTGDSVRLALHAEGTVTLYSH